MRRASVVSGDRGTYSTSLPASSHQARARRRRLGPGGPRRKASWPSASFRLSQRQTAHAEDDDAETDDVEGSDDDV